ncbi:MAG: peptidoglycan/LPS O-acetylase OafA/YrhL, partial [Reinekea sp.]
DKAVDIFFMISAYLLGKSLLRQASEQHIRIRTFYINRVFRIYPLFLLALLIFSLGSWHLFERDFWFNLIFVDNFMHNTIIPVGWSLSVEMQCYLLLPFVIILANKTNSPVLFFSALLVFAIALRAYMALQNPEVYQIPFYAILLNPEIDYQYMDVMYYSTPSRVASFVVGLLWASIVLHPRYRHVCNYLVKNKNLASMLAGICGILILISFYFPVYDQLTWERWPLLQELNFVFVSFHRFIFSLALLALILLSNGKLSLTNRFLSSRFFRPFSKLAFPIYLFHFPALVIAWLLVLQTTKIKTIVAITPLQTGMAAVIAMVIVVWISLPLHYLLEKKFINLGRKLCRS